MRSELRDESGHGHGHGHGHVETRIAVRSWVRDNLAGGGPKCRHGPRSRASGRRGSATESAALLDVCLRLKLVGEAEHRAGKAMILRVVSMLIKLAMSFEDSRPST